MTDKQIKEEIKHINTRNQEYIAENNRMIKKIIDGVDVSKCCNYDDTQFWECEPSNCHCEELPNCYYKQLKRKEQECEKYKQALDEIEEICKVNAINTCWTALNLCDKCDEKEECCLQSPLAKLDAISNIINKTKE